MIAATMTSTRAAYSTAGQTATATSRPVTQPPWCTLPRRPPRRPGLVVTPAEPLLRCWTRRPSHGREPISIKGSGLCHVSRSTIFSNATAQHGSMAARREGPGVLQMSRSAVHNGERRGRCFCRAPGRPRLGPLAQLCVVLVVLFVAAGPAGASPQASPSAALEASASAIPAAEVFAENCSGCHGTRGEGGFGPPLAAAGFASLVAPMVEKGGIQMPSFGGQLSNAQIQGVAEYVAQTVADPEARTAVVADGGEIYRLYCAGCHSTTGRGGALTRGRWCCGSPRSR